MEKFKHANENLTKEQQKQFYVGREDFPEEPCIYQAGDLLSEGNAMLRRQEVKELKGIFNDNTVIYSPVLNMAINDKSKNNSNRLSTLSERIILHDCSQIDESNLVIIDGQETLGTIAEIGYIHKHNSFHQDITNIIENNPNSQYALEKIQQYLDDNPKKKVLPQVRDLRMQGSPDGLDDYFRCETSYNAFVGGELLALTNGHGLYNWSEITNQLQKVYKDK